MQINEDEKTMEEEYTQLIKKKEQLEKKNSELQDFAERKHEITLTLDDPTKIEELKKEEVELEGQIEKMKLVWTDVKQQIEQEIEVKKQTLAEKKIEYTYKAEQITLMKKEISDSLREMRYKEEIIKFLEDEYAKTPKDITRQFYVERISVTITNVKTEKSQIDSTITDIKDLKGVISKTLESIRVSENEIEELVFKVILFIIYYF